MQIVLAENFRAVFYAPFYACLALGFFRDKGLEVVLRDSASPGGGIADMMTGSTDLVWGGPLRVLKDRDQRPAGPHSLVAFGEVAARDPFFLVGRAALADFKLTDLPRLSMASVSEVHTPWLCLQHDLRSHGIDPDSVRRADHLPMHESLRLLSQGAIDVIQVFEPYVTLAERSGAGIPLHAAHARGLTAYTTFLSTTQKLERHASAFQTMAHAIESFKPWLASEGTAELAKLVANFYPSVDRSVLERSLLRYDDANLWSCQTRISRQGFERLANSMLSGRFISAITPYESCVAPWAQAQTL